MKYLSILDGIIGYSCDACGKDCDKVHVEMPPRHTGAAKMHHYCPSCYDMWEKATADSQRSRPFNEEQSIIDHAERDY